MANYEFISQIMSKQRLFVSLLPHLALLTTFQTPNSLGSCNIQFTWKVKYLGFWLDSDLATKQYVIKSVSLPILSLNALVLSANTLQKKQLLKFL